MTKHLLCTAAAAAVALSIAGCANMEWTRPGADAATISRDMDECRAVALGRATPPLAPVGSAAAVSNSGRPAVMSSATISNERFVAEHEDVRRCMSRRGYVLRPAS